jgi:hypothetical protein
MWLSSVRTSSIDCGGIGGRQSAGIGLRIAPAVCVRLRVSFYGTAAGVFGAADHHGLVQAPRLADAHLKPLASCF